jgi:hypothetical protein
VDFTCPASFCLAFGWPENGPLSRGAYRAEQSGAPCSGVHRLTSPSMLRFWAAHPCSRRKEFCAMLSVNSCPHCSTRVPRTLTRCPVCGAPVGARQFDYGTSWSRIRSRLCRRGNRGARRHLQGAKWSLLQPLRSGTGQGVAIVKGDPRSRNALLMGGMASPASCVGVHRSIPRFSIGCRSGLTSDSSESTHIGQLVL